MVVNGMQFNPQKSQLLTIGGNNPVNCNLTISNRTIQWCANVKYLGIVVCNANVFTTDISRQKGKFFSRLNSILSVTGSGRHEMSSVKLINSHCLPTLLYGCEIWCIKQSESYKLNVIWNNVYRKIFNCCWRESVRPLLYYCKSMSISYIIDQRRILFWRKLQASSHVLLQLLASLCVNEHIAVCSRYGISAANVSTYHVKCCVWTVFERAVSV